MSYIFTYNNLYEQVYKYLERSDQETRNNIPVFILLAQTRLGREIKQLGSELVLTGNFVAGEWVVTKPSRWRKTKSFNFGTGTNNNARNILLPRGYEYCSTYWPNPTLTDTPRFYADYDYNHWLIAPTPDQNYPFEAIVYETPEPIDSVVQTNWYTQFAPDLLLYATLLEAAPFLKDDARIATWQMFYDRGMAAINGEALGRINDASTDRKDGV